MGIRLIGQCGAHHRSGFELQLSGGPQTGLPRLRFRRGLLAPMLLLRLPPAVGGPLRGGLHRARQFRVAAIARNPGGVSPRCRRITLQQALQSVFGK
ncbi:MAG: hypothetical protein IPK63_16380 [Candidatus Competibacteraceae bacterium]|nr:hypothetical protein [Candidatus Competibacteraceae bacterium]